MKSVKWGRLQRRGCDLGKRLEALTGIPTYYYLYRVGGRSAAEEKARPVRAAAASGRWPNPCTRSSTSRDPCRLVANLSWDFKD